MKNLCLTLLFLISFSFSYGQNKPKVVVTASMMWDMAKNIGGEYFDIKCIVPIGGDPHLYEPTPKDAQLVADAQLILKNGLTFEGWLDELIDNSGTEAKSVRITEGIDPIKSATYHNAADPHAWMDVSHGFTYIKNIRDAFTELLPEHKEIFENNYTIYLAKLKELDTYILKRIASIPESNRILITSHDAFQYFGRHYNIKLEAILGVSTDAEAQTSDITRLNKVIRESNVPAVFIESTINPKLLKQLAKDNDIVVGGQLFADSIGDEESGGSTYIDMMKHNTDTIVDGLLRVRGAKGNEESDKSSGNIWLFGFLGILFIGGFVYVVRKMNGN